MSTPTAPTTTLAPVDQRYRASALRLVRDALGGPAELRTKAARLLRTARLAIRPAEVRRRVQRLRALGIIDAQPTGLQLALLAADMLRYYLVPGTVAYERQRGLDVAFQQILRVLDDPSSMLDPIGVLTDRDTLIGHLLQVVHAEPVYDLQLLEMFEDGHARLEAEVIAVLAGTHPRARVHRATVEDPGYHARLLAFVRRWRRAPDRDAHVRLEPPALYDPAYLLAEASFHALRPAFAYATRLPTDPRGAVRHLMTRRRIDPALCDPSAHDYAARLAEVP